MTPVDQGGITNAGDAPGGACGPGGTRIPGTLFQFDLAELGPGQDRDEAGVPIRNCVNAIILLDPKLEVAA